MPSPRRTTRRQFLVGKSAVEAVADLGGTPDPAAVPPVSGQPASAQFAGERPASYLLEISRRAMACEFQVLLNAGEHRDAPESVLQALDLVEQLEAQLSVFRPASELSYINRHAFQHPVKVESELFALLKQAFVLSDETAGAFDITASPLWKLWGFRRREGSLPAADEITQALETVGRHLVAWDDDASTVSFLKDGVELNLGAVGKGYALDRCGAEVRACGAESFLFHGGNSSILARGSRAGLPPERHGWSVALVHPLKAGVRLGEIRLRDQALGTSGAAHQFFYHQGKRYGHVLDPRTGHPAQQVLSATVVCPTATMADALSTAFFVMGPDEVTAWCHDHPDVGAILVCVGERSGSIAIHTIGLAEDQWRLHADHEEVPARRKSS